MWQFFHFVINQSNICGIYGNVTADSTHGNPDICLFQCRSIIHTISHHADGFLFLLFVCNPPHFIFWQAVCMHFCHLQLRGNGCDCVLMVACQQHWLHVQVFQLCNHSCTLCSHGIRKHQITSKLSICNHMNHGTALLQGSLYIGLCSFWNENLLFFQQLLISGKHRNTGNLCRNASARPHLKLFCLLSNRSMHLLVALNDCLSKRMLRKLLHCCTEGIEFRVDPLGQQTLLCNDFRCSIG